MILFVNACVRPQSRTKRLALAVLTKLGGDVKEVDLERENVLPLNNAALEYRLKRVSEGDFDDPMFDLAKDFAAAEKIVIAAPYWDLSFPALLKCYIEQISVIGLTFAYNDAGQPYGLCKADRLIYVTTSGGPMFNEDAGFGYIKSLAQNFYGIQTVSCLKAENLDLVGADAESILKKAEKQFVAGDER